MVVDDDVVKNSMGHDWEENGDLAPSQLGDGHEFLWRCLRCGLWAMMEVISKPPVRPYFALI
jgi:hypothetical protein